MRIFLFVIVLFWGAGCRNKGTKGSPTYKAFIEIGSRSASPTLKQLYEKYLLLKHPKFQPALNWAEDWIFMMGDADEALHTNIKPVRGEAVALPHRINKPDCALWYKKRVTIPTDGFVYLRADDGAQLFVNGRQVNRKTDNYFPVQAGNTELIVRVLNNAMSGGLRNVSFCSNQEFQNYINQRNDFSQLKQGIEKVLLHQSAPPAAFDRALLALENPVEENLAALTASMNNFPVITGPWLQRCNKNEFTIKAWLEHTVTVKLRYGFSPDRLDTQLEQNCNVCSFHLTALPVNTTVYYQLTAAKTVSPRYSFSTREEESFSFNIWADSQSGWTGFRKHIINMLRHNDAFGVGVGDLVGNGSDELEWRQFFNLLGSAAAQTPFYLVAGNHDYDGYYDDLVPVNYNRLVLNNPTHQFWTYGNCAFIALDPNAHFPIGIPEGSAQEIWFRNKLQSEKWKQATWRFIVIHQPPYSQGWPGYEGEKVIRDLLEPVIESARIDFVVSGHTHDYERLTKMYGSQKTTFLIVGGAGGALEPEESSRLPKMDTVIKQHHMGRFFIQKTKIRFEVSDPENRLLDSFEQMK